MSIQEPTFGEPLLAGGDTETSWEEGRRRLADAEYYWLATVHPGGQPQIRPLLAVWSDGYLYFCANKRTRKAQNLDLNERCAIGAGGQDAHLMIEGKVEEIRDEMTLESVATVYSSKYGWQVTVRDGAFYGDGAPTAGPPPYALYRLRPAVVFGLGLGENFAPTRWVFRRYC